MDNLPPRYPFTVSNIPSNIPTNVSNPPPPLPPPVDPMLTFNDNTPNMELPTLPSSISEFNPGQGQFGDDNDCVNIDDFINYDNFFFDEMLTLDDNTPSMEVELLPTLPSSISEPNPSNDVINQGQGQGQEQEQEQFGDDNSFDLTDDMLYFDFNTNLDVLDIIHEPNENVNSGNYVGESSAVNGQRINEQENVWKNFGNPLKTSVWSVSPQPYVCSDCQLLREIKFYNGKSVRHLEVHGQVGSVYHAILNKFDYDNMSTANHEYLMFDFSGESAYSVRNYLIKFCQQCKNEGYNLAANPLSKFYKTICIGLNGNVAASDNNTSSPIDIMDSGDDVRLPSIDNGKETATESSHGARQDGMKRWPHRKIKGLRNKILKKKEELSKVTFEEKANILVELQKLEQELAMAIEEQ